MFDDLLHRLVQFMLILLAICIGYSVGDSIKIIYQIEKDFIAYSIMIALSAVISMIFIKLFNRCFEEDEDV